MIIGVDCDNTVVGVDHYWWEWLNCMCKTDKQFPSDSIINYNLSDYFRQELNERRMDGLEWWRGTTQYDTMKPFPDAVEYLGKLSDKHSIVFVSSIKGNHAKSKYYFLNRYFPFLTEVTFMKKKMYAAVEALIDDRIEHHNNAPQGRINVWYKTPHTQIEENIGRVDLHTNSWEEIYNYFKGK